METDMQGDILLICLIARTDIVYDWSVEYIGTWTIAEWHHVHCYQQALVTSVLPAYQVSICRGMI